MLFKALGVLLACCAVCAAWRGEVVARSRWSGRTIERSAEPQYFRVVIAIHAALAIALLTVF